MTLTACGTLPDTSGYLLHHEQGISLANCRLPILAIHGHGGTAFAGEQGGLMDQGGHLRALSQSGYAVLSVDAGVGVHGTAGWGSPNVMSSLDAAFAFIGRPQVGIVGYSMGGLSTLNWVKRNAAKVAAVWLWEPCTDLAWADSLPGYAPSYGLANSASWTSEITAEYGSWAATAGYRVYDEYASWRLGVPIHVVHASDDTVIPPAQTDAFIAGVNEPYVTLRSPAPTGNHTGVFLNVPAVEMLAFFER